MLFFIDATYTFNVLEGGVDICKGKWKQWMFKDYSDCYKQINSIYLKVQCTYGPASTIRHIAVYIKWRTRPISRFDLVDTVCSLSALVQLRTIGIRRLAFTLYPVSSISRVGSSTATDRFFLCAVCVRITHISCHHKWVGHPRTNISCYRLGRRRLALPVQKKKSKRSIITSITIP